MKHRDDKDKKKKGAGAGAAAGAALGGVGGGAAAGAAAGGMTGPVGAVVGAAVGAAVGALAGRGAAAADDGRTGDPRASAGSRETGIHTVIGVFDDRAAAQRAVDRLADGGFARHDIHLQDQQAGGATGDDRFFPSLFGTDAAADGRMQQGPYAMRAHTYDEAVRRGNAVVVIDAWDETQADRASALLHEAGAVDVDERSRQWRAEGWRPPEGTDTGDLGERGKLDVVQEELDVGKREVQRGGVRVVQRMSQKPVREIVRLREEHARVERHPVDRPASPDDLNTFREGTMEVRERGEVPVVGKSARVVEEVSVSKDVREREETIEDTVRRKDVDVQRIEGSDNRAVRDERAFASDRDGERLRAEQERAGTGRSPTDPDKPR